MRFTDEEQKHIDALPPILRLAVNYLTEALHNVISGNCNENTFVDTIATLNNNASMRFSDSDLLTYDAACKELHISVTNRVKLKKLLDLHGIKQVVIHNQKVGFKRSEILALKARLYKRSQERREKNIRKADDNEKREGV